MNVIAELML